MCRQCAILFCLHSNIPFLHHCSLEIYHDAVHLNDDNVMIRYYPISVLWQFVSMAE